MTLLSRALAGWTMKQTERLPVTQSGTVLPGTYLGGGFASNETYGQLATSSWLLSVVDRIGVGLASVQWRLIDQLANGDEREVFSHPALDLWKKPNAYLTRFEMLERANQYFQLVGEIPFVVLRDSKTGQPAELQLVRPNRIFPIPDPNDYLAGYVYQVGAQRIFLKPEDVIMIVRPNPLNEYRGLGIVQSLLIDLGSEQAAATWMRNFFRNSAIPGGVIEVDATLDEAQYQRLRAQWAENHQGVTNAHRVAILERSHWKDAAFTQRDMQFEQLRKLSRDVILGAFGMPKSALGVTEDVNRANAEAGEVVYARWIVRPLAERIAQELTDGLLPLFTGKANLRFSYVDPTPEDRIQNLQESVQGWNAGLLTKNEGRNRLGLGDVPDGDEFKQAAPSLFDLPPDMEPKKPKPEDEVDEETDEDEEEEEAKKQIRAKTANPLYVPAVNAELANIEGHWADRLTGEMNGLLGHLEGTNKTYWQKLEVTDVDGWSWDWWEKYGDDVVKELTTLFFAAIRSEMPDMPEANVQRLAGNYARERAARLLKLENSFNLVEQTRERVRVLVAETVQEGGSVQALSKKLREDFTFSKARAETVARTETAEALGEGQLQSALYQGRDEKRWITQGATDPRVDQICLDNEAEGWIAISQPFRSGHDRIPAHPNCMCKTTYRTADLHEEEEATPPEFRCVECNKLLAKNPAAGAAYWCRTCKVERVSPVPAGQLVRREVKHVLRDKDDNITEVIVEERTFNG